MAIDILQDVSTTGRERPWREHKISNELLAHAYDAVDPAKAVRLRECGTQLDFEVTENGHKKLVGMWSCRVRLCPLCTWRRSLKVGAQMTQIVAAMGEKYAYLLLTLTIRNCDPDRLNSTITDMMRGFQRLQERRRVSKATEGTYRALEITHNLDDDTYHPHFHCLVAVRPGYFKGGRYIPQAEWTQLWREAMRLDYDPVVDVRRVKGRTAAAIAEVAKYSAKTRDFLIPDDWELTIKSVQLLDKALHKRRLVAFTGIFREIHRKLHLDDAEDGDLVHLDGQAPERPENRVVHYLWYSGYRQYRRINLDA